MNLTVRLREWYALITLELSHISGSMRLYKRAFFVYRWRMKTRKFDPRKFKKDFFSRLGDFSQIQPLLDSLHDIPFYFMDRKDRCVMNNLRTVALAGVASEEEMLGKTGYDFFPSDRVDIYHKQNHQVMRTGKPIINAIAPAPEKGSNAMTVYSKIPLRDKRGRIIGVAGAHREIKGLHSPSPTYGRLSRAVQMMHDHYAEQLTISELASIAGMSRSQFDRHFHRLFGSVPRDYLMRVRINAACHLLSETDRKTTEIALDTGFYDHSHFSRSFRRIIGMNPLAYRRKHLCQS
jgi:AraC-like DNA-binding protein